MLLYSRGVRYYLLQQETLRGRAWPGQVGVSEGASAHPVPQSRRPRGEERQVRVPKPDTKASNPSATSRASESGPRVVESSRKEGKRGWGGGRSEETRRKIDGRKACNLRFVSCGRRFTLADQKVFR